jgi:hypothetical protein
LTIVESTKPNRRLARRTGMSWVARIKTALLLRAAAGGVAAVLLVVGCASTSTGAGSPSGSPAASSASRASSSSALDLVGAWTVQAQGIAPGTILVLGDDLEVWSSCGVSDGSWAADTAGQFVAEIFGGSATCMPSPPPTSEAELQLAWLTNVASFTASRSNATLLDVDGHPLVQLSTTSTPVGNADAAPPSPYPPVPDARLTARLAPPPALPAGVRPASETDLVGRWTSAQAGANPKAYLSFAADGTWQSYDGCNQGSGLWRDTGGHVVAVAGPIAGVGCDNMTDLTQPLFNAAQVGLTSSGTLELFDPSGGAIAHLMRTAVPGNSSSGSSPAANG